MGNVYIPSALLAPNIAPQANAQIISGTLGASVIVFAGALLYYDTVSGSYFLAVASSTQAQSVVAGMAVNSGSPGQTVAIQIAGDVAMGTILTTGQPYVLSDTGNNTTTGGCLADTLPAANTYPSAIGMGISTSILRIAIANNNNVSMGH